MNGQKTLASSGMAHATRAVPMVERLSKRFDLHLFYGGPAYTWLGATPSDRVPHRAVLGDHLRYRYAAADWRRVPRRREYDGADRPPSRRRACAHMDHVLSLIIEILSRTPDLRTRIPPSDITLRTRFKEDLGFDSLALMSLAFELQEHYPELDEMQIATWVTVEDCARSAVRP
jgi:acyl carrier protein